MSRRGFGARSPRARAAAAICLGATLLGGVASAEDSVQLWGNYYKETSTRVISPQIRVEKDLPYDINVNGSYLVDQVTSASAALTSTDQLISKYRQEARLGVSKRLLDFLTPGIGLRYSYEPDYTSRTVGGELRFGFNQDLSTFRVYTAGQFDSVYKRGRPNFQESVDTLLLGISGTQVLRKDLLAGLTLETQRVRGYIQSQYRVENTPRSRNRYAAKAWGRYFFEPTRTAVLLGYRYYWDDWLLRAHSLELELSEPIVTDLEARVRFRYYTQTGAFFAPNPVDGYLAQDPTLYPYDAEWYGLDLYWTQSWLSGTFLGVFANSRVEPSYTYVNQHNAFGAAHVAQLGWYWPF